MVNNINDCKSDEWLKIHTNGGPTIFKQMAKLRLSPLNAHFNEASMATIISFLDLYDINGIRAIFGLNMGVHFDVILPTGETFRFKRANSIILNFDIEVDSYFITYLSKLSIQLMIIQIFKLL